MRIRFFLERKREGEAHRGADIGTNRGLCREETDGTFRPALMSTTRTEHQFHRPVVVWNEVFYFSYIVTWIICIEGTGNALELKIIVRQAVQVHHCWRRCIVCHHIDNL